MSGKFEYSYSHWCDFKEILVPVNLGFSKKINKSIRGFINTGFYLGSFLEYNYHGPHHTIDGVTYYWSEKEVNGFFESFSTDININPGSELILSKNISLTLSAFYKYRIIQQRPLSLLFNRSIYGIKAGLIFNLSGKNPDKIVF